MHRRPLSAALLAAAVIVTSCASEGTPEASPPVPDESRARAERGGGERGGTREEPGAPTSDGVLLSSSFEGEVCGRWQGTPDPGCEFGVEGGVETGLYDPRTGERAVRLDRTSPKHMGVIADLPLPEGRAFVGIAHRVPAIPAGAIPDQPGHLQLEQLSPTDGTLPAWTVEVRLYPDRRLGLALFRGDDVVMADWPVPEDEWFYVVVELAHGPQAVQRMWLYDADDRLRSEVAIPLKTEESWPHEGRTAQKIGGSTASRAPLYTYVDDWYVAERSLGPVRIDAGGALLDG